MSLDRRSFIKSAIVTGGLAAMAGLTACAAEPGKESDAQPSTTEQTVIEPSETKECDICVVGAGLSGLSACVQAGELGLNVIALESGDDVGGGARMGVEGTFGLNSEMMKTAGVEVDSLAILNDELSQAQQRSDALLWREFFNVAGENINWLVEQGVEFNGTIDNYHSGKFNTFHWYKDGKAAAGYVPAMSARTKELGVDVIVNTTAKKLIADENGKITGVYAQQKNGDWLQVNAKAVILASGGFGSNAELVSRIGYDQDRLGCMFENAQGHGYLMAMEMGAVDTIPGCCDQNAPMLAGVPQGQTNMLFCLEPEIPWINENCERFYAEDIVVTNMSYSNPPKWNQKDYFMIWDTKMLEGYSSWGVDSTGDFTSLVEAAVENDDGSVYRCDTIRELAEGYNLDADALEKFVEDYNRMCAEGIDELFGKSAEYMQPIENGPFYIARPIWVVFCVVGGIGTNHNAQVVRDRFEPVDGLYAIGNDGCMLYRNIYTIDTPGTCSGWGIASGRKAVNHAFETYVK